MARVTAEEVAAIIEVDSSLDLSVFITTATTYVDALLQDLDYSDEVLTQIELYLSAHFASVRQRQLTEEVLGDASRKYTGKFGTGLDATQYGQTAQALDYLGGLSNAGKGAIVFQAL